MARKRKSKGTKKKRRPAKKGPRKVSGDAPEAADPETPDKAPGEKPETRSAEKPKKKPKKKPRKKPKTRATKASTSEAAPQGSPAVVEPPASPSIEGRKPEPPMVPVGTSEHVPPSEPADAAAVADLDEEPDALDPPGEPEVVDLDEGDDSDEAVALLIAQTVAGVEEEPSEPDASVIDLDAEMPDAEMPDAHVADDEASTRADPEPAAAPDGEDRGVPEGEAPGPDAVGTEVPAAAADQPAVDEPDLGPVSSPEARARLLAQALAHAEHQEARYRTPFTATSAAARWKAALALVLLMVAAVVGLAPPGWARPDPPAQLAPADRARNLRVALLLQAQQVEAFRLRAQRLPATLDEVPGTVPGIHYVRSGTRAYQLIAYERDGNAIVYDSADPTPAFATIATGWRAPGRLP